MSPSPQLMTTLLQDTASVAGSDYFHALAASLARQTGAGLVVLTQQHSLPRPRAHILASTPSLPVKHYDLDGTPCGQVMQSLQPLLCSRNVRHNYPAEADTDWQAYAGWPLVSANGQCLGHLALFDTRPDAFQGLDTAMLSPFLARASAELALQAQQLAQHTRARWDALHTRMLRQYIHATQSLTDLLALVVLDIEALLPGWLCSIVRVDHEGMLRPLTGPSLPDSYHQLIDGLPIGPMVGSCGAAAWSGHRVVAEDLQQHPNWQPFREVASQYQLGSCWSEPIIGTTGKVYGTFAVYHRSPTAPTESALEILADTAHLLALLLENSEIRERLDSQRDWYQAILQNSVDALSIINLEGRFIEVCDALCQMLGYSADELLQMHLWEVIPDADPYEVRARLAATSTTGETFESTNRCKDGTLVEVEVSARRLILDGQPVIWGSARDIRERKALERQLREQASTDVLTGLANRQTFLSQLQALHREYDAPLTLWMIDLDHFKTINDCYGHDCGDKALIHFANVLRHSLPPHALAGRLGGEEFGVLLPGFTPAESQPLVNALLTTLRQTPLHYGEQAIPVRASIGITHRRRGDDEHALLLRADKALYQAKRAGRDGCATEAS